MTQGNERSRTAEEKLLDAMFGGMTEEESKYLAYSW